MRMQRIAWAAIATALLAAITGCPPPSQRERDFVPTPILNTRATAPRATPPPAPPPRDEPQVVIPGVKLDTKALIPPRGISRGNWRVIVVHHSATEKDTPQQMHRYHLVTRGWSNGLGYHFVIGNGVNYPDGQIFVGPRWRSQIQGAHCKAGSGRYFGVQRPDNFFNDHGIGICLIGDFDNRRPSSKQLAALQQLITFLCGQTGIKANSVYGHGEVTSKTACPGKQLRSQLAVVKRNVAQSLARSGAGEFDLVPIAIDAGELDFAAAPQSYLERALRVRDLLAEGCDTVDADAVDLFDDVADSQVCDCSGCVGGDFDDEHADPFGFAAAVAARRGIDESAAAPEDFVFAERLGPQRLATLDADGFVEPLATSFDR